MVPGGASARVHRGVRCARQAADDGGFGDDRDQQGEDQHRLGGRPEEEGLTAPGER